MPEFNSVALGFEVGSGAMLGAIAGYAAKKVIKVAVVMLGIVIAGFKFLEAKGFIVVNWDKFTGVAQNTTNTTGQATATGMDLAGSMMSALPFGGSFAAGFMVGMKKG